MIKRIVVLLLILFLCLTFSACGEKKEAWDAAAAEKQSAVFSMNNTFGYAQVLGKTLYFAEKNMNGECRLRYLDLETGESMYLCARPECVHKDKNCDAYLGNTGSPELMIYNGRIYWTSMASNAGVDLNSMKLDGSDRRKEKGLDTSLYSEGGYKCISGDIFFSCNSRGSISNGSIVYSAEVYSEPISENGESKVIYSEVTNGAIPLGMIWEGRLWFASQIGTENANHVKLYAYEVDSQKLEMLAEWDSQEVYCSMLMVGGKVVISAKGSWTEYNTEDGTLDSITDEEAAENSSYYLLGYGFCYKGSGRDSIRSFDYEGNELYSGTVNAEGIDFMQYFKNPFGIYEGRIVWYLTGRPDGPGDRIILIDPNNGEAQVIWSADRE